MRGGLFEATLCLDELSTEVIADGCHLSPELLRLAWKVKGPNRLALVTDAMRAMDLPPGEYVFGPNEAGVKVFQRQSWPHAGWQVACLGHSGDGPRD